MRYLLPKICFATAVAHAANASEELIKMSQNPKEWVMPTGNYSNHRYRQRQSIFGSLLSACEKESARPISPSREVRAVSLSPL